MRTLALAVCGVCLLGTSQGAVEPTARGAASPRLVSHWKGRKAAFLGDSITDKAHVGTTANYWNYLADILGIDAYVYGENGRMTDRMVPQAERVLADLGDDVDAIFLLTGTNDYNCGIRLGEWFKLQDEEVVDHGRKVTKPRRIFSTDASTFRGRLNLALRFLKAKFPRQQIVLLTPLHRGFARFGGADTTNIQPEETFCNGAGLHIDDYVRVVREAGGIWSVPVIDLYAESGLFPVEPAHAMYFHDAETDRLHPNAAGHRRIAETMAYRLLSMPPDFKF